MRTALLNLKLQSMLNASKRTRLHLPQPLPEHRVAISVSHRNFCFKLLPIFSLPLLVKRGIRLF